MKSRALIPIATAGLAALVAYGCGGHGGGDAQAPRAAGAPAATTGGAAATGGDFGVPECDDYIKKYLACVDSKVPESARAMVRQQLDQTRAQWKQAASTPEGRAGLAMGCTQATQAARAAMAAYGCTF
jgi:hypothetical protein